MLKNIDDIVYDINKTDLENFISNTNADFICKKEIKETKIDYSWLDILEDTLDNLDFIVRNPRSFIIQEEEVLIVEKTKKVNQETIKHLAQHSQNIQDINEAGEVVPKKLLNVRKEDTIDLYENRFMYTLVKRLQEFINRMLDNFNDISNKEIKKDVIYKAKTKYNNKDIDINLNIKEIDNMVLDNDVDNLKKRILACYEIIESFRTSPMLKNLIGCTLVKNPIRKTNLILREPNFRKAHILWQYLDNYELKDPKVVSYESTTDISNETKDEFSLGYYIDVNALNEETNNLSNQIDIDKKLDKLLDEYVYVDNYNFDDFVNKCKKYYSEAIIDKNKRLDNIKSIYNKFISDNEVLINSINDVL